MKLVREYIRALPAWKRGGARLQLGHWLKKQGHKKLSATVMRAATIEELTPHLEAIEEVVPATVTAEEIFPRVFTDPVTLRHELTAMIGGSVRDYPREDTPEHISIDDRLEILRTLKARIKTAEAALAVKKKKATKKSLMGQIDALLKTQPSAGNFEDRLDALVIEAGGYAIGITGEMLDDSVMDRGALKTQRAVEGHIYSALYFLDVVSEGTIHAMGPLRKDDRMAATLFLQGAAEVWQKPPKFLKSLSRYWGRFSAGRSPEGITRSMGLAISNITEPRIRLAHAARLPPLRLLSYLHLLEVEKHIYARGWLKGYARYHEGRDSGRWAQHLMTNSATITGRAIQLRNPGYIIRVVEALPTIVTTLNDAASMMEPHLAAIIQANEKTIINHALNLGKLTGYITAAIRALPQMAERMDRTSLSRALSNGQLDDGD